MPTPDPFDGVVDLFAGPGGWEEGLRRLGHDRVVGVEHDHDACRTATAAGHARLEADVATYPPDPFVGAVGLIASPPCQAYSLAGAGKGRDAIDRLLDAALACRGGWVDPPAAICGDDVRADLTLQPLRWADALRPEWIVCEQVPPALSLWEATAHVLRAWGYQADARVLNAADYGVPQTRRRAILVARRDGRRVEWPEVTHHDPRRGLSLFGAPWVSMAEALGIPATFAVDRRAAYVDGEPTVPPVGGDRPAPTLTGTGLGRGVWQVVDRPAPTISGGGGSDNGAGILAGVDVRRRLAEDAEHVDPEGPAGWVFDRPATTVVGSFRPDVIAAPGWRSAGDGPRQDAPGSVRISIAAASVLQSFPADYPWTGTKSSRFQQCGNAVPPGLAAAILRPIVG